MHDLDRRQMAEIRPQRRHEIRLRKSNAKESAKAMQNHLHHVESIEQRHACARTRTHTRAHTHARLRAHARRRTQTHSFIHSRTRANSRAPASRQTRLCAASTCPGTRRRRTRRGARSLPAARSLRSLTAAAAPSVRAGPGFMALRRASDGEVQMPHHVAPRFGEAAGGQAGAVLKSVPAAPQSTLSTQSTQSASASLRTAPSGMQCRPPQLPCAVHCRSTWRAPMRTIGAGSVRRTRRGGHAPRGPSGVGHRARRLRQNHDRQPCVRINLREPAASQTGVRRTWNRCDVRVALRRCIAVARRTTQCAACVARSMQREA